MDEIVGKVVMVTGGGRGIGRSIARGFASAGATVAVCDVLDAEGRGTVRDIEAEGGRAAFINADVASATSVAEAVDEVVTTFGDLNICVNNAGVRAVAPVMDLEIEDWDRVIGVNLSGVFYSMKYQLPHLIRNQGSIVNISSIWGIDGWPNRSAYVASKHGVVGLTKSAAQEYGTHGVRINAVAPGPIKTDAAVETVSSNSEDLAGIEGRTALKSFGEPEDVAQAVMWLSQARNVTGAVLAVDGGWGAI